MTNPIALTPKGVSIFRNLEQKAPHVVAEAKRALQAERPLTVSFGEDEIALCSLSIAARNELVLRFLISEGLIHPPGEEEEPGV